eukprot:TRINITY_DN4632_c0_g1_i2.p3 TRINITY_DN4632_c0_g1~~TRINITY_DN4632_c0_g1_i2.p3  ORF type:complete len:101 (-),score=10.31 TRINITY_DN4632_c0_g1_i2:215-517(-)
MSGESSLSWRGSLILPNELYIGGIFDTVNLVKQDNTHNIRAYVMKTRKYGRDKAFYDVVRKAHPCACPNNGFWEQLAEYERILSAEMELDMDVQTSKNEF